LLTGCGKSHLKHSCAQIRQKSYWRCVFAARTHHGDGRKYIPDALARGAIAVVYDVADGDTFVWDESISVPHFAVPDLSQQLG
jgi:UDP-N-acetylmuramyl tripeptide synthase